MIKAVLFDMDGLMFDTERLSNKAWLHVGELLELPVGEGFLMSLKGRNREDCAALMRREWGPLADIEEIRERHQEYISGFLAKHGVPVKPGLIELMEYLKERGFCIGLATSTGKQRAERLLRESGMIKYFDQLVFGDMVEKGKPEPDIYVECARRTGSRPGECLVLEDSPSGVLAGFRAGCHVIMVPDYVLPTEKERQRTDRIVSSLYGVMEYLDEMGAGERAWDMNLPLKNTV